jgi:hypothetical protein
MIKVLYFRRDVCSQMEEVASVMRQAEQQASVGMTQLSNLNQALQKSISNSSVVR